MLPMNGTPLQYSCLENPRDRGAWWAAVYGFAQSWTRLKRLSSSSICIYVCNKKQVQKYICIHLCICIIFQFACIIPKLSFHLKICHGDHSMSVHVVLFNHCIIFHNMELIILILVIKLFAVTY